MQVVGDDGLKIIEKVIAMIVCMVVGENYYWHILPESATFWREETNT